MLSRDHNILWLPESNGYPTLAKVDGPCQPVHHTIQAREVDPEDAPPVAQRPHPSQALKQETVASLEGSPRGLEHLFSDRVQAPQAHDYVPNVLDVLRADSVVRGAGRNRQQITPPSAGEEAPRRDVLLVRGESGTSVTFGVLGKPSAPHTLILPDLSRAEQNLTTAPE